MIVYVAELQPILLSTGAAQTLRYCSHPSAGRTDGLDWLPMLATPFRRSTQLFDGKFKDQPQDFGALEVAFSKGHSGAPLTSYGWDGRTVKIWKGTAGQTTAQMQLVFSGTVENVSGNRRRYVVKLRGPNLDKPLLGLTYAGSGDAEGPGDLKGRLKPMLVGSAMNIEPVYVNRALGIFQYHAYAQAQDGTALARTVTAVYDSGAQLGTSIGDYPSYAALAAAAIPAGRYATCNALGMGRHGGDITGVLTIDAGGSMPGGLPGDILVYFLNSIAGLDPATQYVADDLTWLTTQLNHPHDWYITDQMTVEEACREFMLALGGYVWYTDAGKFTVGLVRRGAAASVTLDRQNIRDASFLPTSAPVYMRRQGYQRSWRTHSYSEVRTPAEIKPRGAWSATPNPVYQYYDLVDYGPASYIYVSSVAGNQATPGTDAAVWQLFQTNGAAVVDSAAQPSSPVQGMLWRNSTSGLLSWYDNGAWVGLADITAVNTAAAISGQGPGATAPAAEVLNYREGANATTISAPVGGEFGSLTSPHVGALKIKLPQLWTNTMIRFAVDVFDYDAGAMQTYYVAGYLYEGTGTGGYWVAPSASYLGPEVESKPVYFGSDGTTAAVWIGDAGTNWNYPKAVVRDVLVGQVGITANQWKAGWAVGIDPSGKANTSGLGAPLTIEKPRPGDAVFGEGVFELPGGAIATLPAFKTIQGTAAGISGQAPAATDPTIQTGATNDTIPDTRNTNQLPSWYRTNYPRRRIAEFKDGQALGITGTAGSWGTLETTTDYGDSSGGVVKQQFTFGGGANPGLSYIRFGASDDASWGTWFRSYAENQKPFFGSDLLETNGGVVASLENFKTPLGTAAGFAGQGALATKGSVNFLGGVDVTNLPYSLQAFSPGGGLWAGRMMYSDSGGVVVTAADRQPQESGANITENRVAASVTGQGPGATALAHEVLNNRGSVNQLLVPFPDGGAFDGGNSHTGRINITMPAAAKNSYAMMSFDVVIYNFSTNTSQRYQIAGYIYNGSTLNGSYNGEKQWYNMTVTYLGAEEMSVRVGFGYTADGVPVVQIGFDGTVWSYPKVMVQNVRVPGGNAAAWAVGWSIAIAAGELSVSAAANGWFINKPRAGDQVFGEGIKEAAGGAVATLPNFKTSSGTAAAIAGQTAWATYTADIARVSKLNDSGRVLDPTIYNTQLLVGAQSTTNLSPSYTVGASNVTVNLPAHTRKIAGPSGPITLSYGAVSGTVAFSSYWTAYIDDPDLTGFSAPTAVFTSNPDDLLYPGRYQIASGISPDSAGTGGTTTSGGGGGAVTDCVAAYSWVEVETPLSRECVSVMGRHWVRARDVLTMDRVRVLVDGTDLTDWRLVRGNFVIEAQAVRLRTEGGWVLDVSDTTPVTQRDGSTVLATVMHGREVAVDNHGVVEWERCSVEEIGTIEVAHLSCSDGTYLAGNEPGQGLFTHNAYAKP